MSNHTVRDISKTSIPPTPIHPLSAFVTIVIDWLWSMVEIPATLSVAGLIALLPIMLVSMATCFVPVLLVQRFVSRDDWGASLAKGVAMGIAAGVPYPVIGTISGGALLAWAGVHEIEMVARKYLPNPK